MCSRIRSLIFSVAMTAATALPAQAQENRLPDLITDEATLADIFIDDSIPGLTRLRLSNLTANIGRGPLEVRAGEVVSPDRQLVNQRIYDGEGGYRDRPAGTFTYHESHQHVHFDGWAAYRLRAVAPDGGVGEIVAEGVKTSFCLFDLRVHDPEHPTLAPFPAPYRNCDFGVQGISPGWADVYSRTLPDQWIDITGLPLDSYWLESEVDPDDAVLEENEDNNVARILITTVPPPEAVPDAYEDNDQFGQVERREVATHGSPNLGPIEIARVIRDLSIEDFSDYFRFELVREGPPGSHVSTSSEVVGRNIHLALFDGDRRFIARSVNPAGYERISLEGLPPGAYFARVFPAGAGVQNPRYDLEVSLVPNFAPAFGTVIPGGELWLERGFETLPVMWWVKDPEGSPTWVSLSMEREGGSDEDPVPLDSYQKLAGEAGGANVNTALMPLGAWQLVGEATDGAAITRHSPRHPFAVYVKGDVSGDGLVDETDWDLFEDAYTRGIKPPRGWRHILDMDRDGRMRKNDFELLLEAVHAHDHHDGSHEHDGEGDEGDDHDHAH